MSTWDDEHAPAREWLVNGYIPRQQPTLISGPGGTGKSILLMQLLASTALGLDWIELAVAQGAAIYLCAEETEDEVRRRLEVILDYYSKKFADLTEAGFKLLTFTEEDPALAKYDRKNGMQPTKLFKRLAATAETLQPKIIAIDTLSDVFIGDEIDRAQVRQFGSLMRRLAIRGDTAVITASHPSLTGMNTGSGLSGSTQWHNSVRSRCYFTNPDDDKGVGLIDNGRRELRFLKNQYGQKAKPMELQWLSPGVWVPSTLTVEDRSDGIDRMFLMLLGRATGQKRETSPNKRSPNYAPDLFAEQPEAKLANIAAAIFTTAMERLLAGGKIKIEPLPGPKSRRNGSKLVAV
jgi:RecA-family ATPase